MQDVSEASSTDVMKQIYLNYLTSKARTDPSIAFSRQFVLAQWCHYDQGKGEEVIEYYKSQWELPAKAANSSYAFSILYFSLPTNIRMILGTSPLREMVL